MFCVQGWLTCESVKARSHWHKPLEDPGTPECKIAEPGNGVPACVPIHFNPWRRAGVGEVSDRTLYSGEPVLCFIMSTQVKVSGTASWSKQLLGTICLVLGGSDAHCVKNYFDHPHCGRLVRQWIQDIVQNIRIPATLLIFFFFFDFFFSFFLYVQFYLRLRHQFLDVGL